MKARGDRGKGKDLLRKKVGTRFKKESYPYLGDIRYIDYK